MKCSEKNVVQEDVRFLSKSSVVDVMRNSSKKAPFTGNASSINQSVIQEGTSFLKSLNVTSST